MEPWSLLFYCGLVFGAALVVLILNRAERPDVLRDSAERRRAWIRAEREARWKD